LAQWSFDRTAKRAAALGILVLLVVAGAGAAGAGPWLRQAFAQLFAAGAATAGLDLSVPRSDFESYAEPWHGAAPRLAPRGGPNLRLLRDDEAWAGGAPAGSSLFVPYAGFGFGAFRLSMNLAERGFGLSKERRQRKLRVFAGLGYALAPSLTTNLEYRALPVGDPMVSLDLGGLAFDLDNPFQDHNVSLKLRYGF
jgi:opacity protein-like surface antigen